MNKWGDKKLQFIFKIVKQHIGYFIISLFIVLICVLLNLILPILIQKFIDIIVEKNFNNNYIKIIMITYICVCVLIYIFSILKTYISDTLGWNITNDLRIKLTKRILNYDQKFFNKYSIADILEFYDKDITTLFTFFSKSLIELTVNIFTIIGILCVFFYKNIFIGLAFTGFMFISLFTIYKVQAINNTALFKEREYNNQVTGLYNQIISCRKSINILGKVNYIIDKLNKTFKVWLPLKTAAQKYLYKVWITTLILLSLANSLSIVIGGIGFKNKIITLGTVYLLYSYSNMLKQPMEYMQVHLQVILKVIASLKRLSCILEYVPEVQDGPLNLENENFDIKIKHLYHSYNKIYVLKDINLSIDKSEKIGIVGNSGSGKSTLCKLICKLENLYQGKIYINGKNLNDISINSIRQHIALFSTSSQIFNGTLRENLTLFNSKISDDEILKILRKYDVESMFVNGVYKENILDRKVDKNSLSSGQQQLVNLCRLLFTNKNLLIFDESSSRIDKNLEDKFYRIVDTLMNKSTSIIITHNIERLKNCNKILVLNEGSVIEYDTLKNLKNNPKSIYNKMLNKKIEVI